MITKQNKLKQIKKQMDQVNRKTGSPVKFSKMADIVTDSLAKLKHITEADLIGLNRDAEDGDEYKQEADVEDSKEKHQGLKVDSKGLTSAQVSHALSHNLGLDSKIVEFLCELLGLSNV
mmetsp:Transcript_33154/g.72360  ORF Transcript_33154/g.72360 Transcript_33154/m.72360 type:complete len:119 (+) Transcript_33154:442-798(+)